MNVKDLLLEVNSEEIINWILENRYKDDFIIDKTKENWDEKIRKNYLSALEAVKRTSIKKDNESIVVGTRYLDLDLDNNITEDVDVYLLKKQDLNAFSSITSLLTSQPEKLPESYGLMFIPWSEFLGFEIAECIFSNLSKAEVAGFLLYELTWFGYSEEVADKNIEDEVEKLEESRKEIENGGKTYTMDEVREMLGLSNEKTEEEKKEEERHRNEFLEKMENVVIPENQKRKREILVNVWREIVGE